MLVRLSRRIEGKNIKVMKTISVSAELRTDMGKKASRDLRAQDRVPGIIYGGEKEIPFHAKFLDLRPIVYTGDFMITEIEIDGTTYRCILKDLQFDSVTDNLTHVDFLELVDGKKVIAELPLNFVGQPIGVTRDGGRLVLKMNTLKVRTYPKYLVENIEVDISKLRLLQNVRVEDVKVENIEVMNPPRQPIASITLTRVLRQVGSTSDDDYDETEDGEEGEEEGEDSENTEE